MNDRDLLTLARQHCTVKQLEALELSFRGYGSRRIGRILGISPQAADARIQGAYRKIRRHQRKDAA